ncbi:MAG: chitobiase/beta-hexosaminidase C-terminal domain-containing protein [Kiritimatiellaeota bacterium]|nr:chitobiase/beta-hexosaminidase C-terminal domain-containing protein [Kiritimatiellota bacterium]
MKLLAGPMLLAGMALSALALTAKAADWKPVPGNIMTRWAAQVDPARPLPEHPRPQLVRPAWQNLNGLWQFEIAAKEAAQPAQFSRQILVPYPVESALSGIKQRVSQKDRLWYRRDFSMPAAWRKGRVLLHFTASDWSTEVFVNGKPVGKHEGGYDPFEFDVTDFLTPGGGQSLVVSVWDPTAEGGQPHGKQTLVKHNIFYTSSSGLWGTVWLEAVPKSYVKGIKMVPDSDAGMLKLTVQADAGMVRAIARDGQTKVGEASGQAGAELVLRVPNAKLWTPDTPFLYDLDITLTDGAAKDTVQSYFGMRKISIGPDEKGVTRILLNNKFVFQTGPLDQGWWPDGLYTAPTDEALKYDIEMIKAHGFNMVRKHVKVEPDRWFYWCDKLGVMAWQDMPSCGRGIPGDSPSPADKTQFELELRRMIETRYNHPSIIMWVIFNEGWGQHDTERLAGLVKTWDPHRVINEASGGMFKGAGDVIDDHLYPFPPGPKPTATRASVAGECGGLGMNVKDHTWNDAGWGYRSSENEEELAILYEQVIASGLRLARENGISGVVYTQLSDIETENNGLMTYDRAVSKVKPDVTRALLNGWLPPRKTKSPGMFVGTGTVALEAPAAGVGIVYTLDGSEPTAKSTAYREPIEITRDTVVKARAVWPGGGLSRVVEFPMLEARPGRQLITNPGFERGVLPWSNNSDSTVLLDDDVKMDNDRGAYTPHDGKKHFRLQGGKDQTIYLTQAVALPAGDYALSMWVMSRANSANNLGSNLSLELLDGNAQVVKPVNSSSPDCLSPKGVYVQWTRQYSGLKTGAYTVKFSAGPTTTAQGKQGWVDDFSLLQRSR